VTPASRKAAGAQISLISPKNKQKRNKNFFFLLPKTKKKIEIVII
jgi:hypothetical protein